MLYIFDLGEVWVRNNDPVGSMAFRLGLPNTREFLTRFHPVFDDLCTGRASAQDFWHVVNAELGTSIETDLWASEYSAHVDSCMQQLVLDLKAGGNRVVAGTNTMAAHLDYHNERGHLDTFDAVYASHLMGVQKPSPAFYTHILEAEEYPPSETWFIDDLAINVAAWSSRVCTLRLLAPRVRDSHAFRIPVTTRKSSSSSTGFNK